MTFITWNWEIISKSDKINWTDISKNTDLPWNWYSFSQNPNLILENVKSLIDFKICNIEDFDWNSISEHVNITWIDVKYNRLLPWVWLNLSKNPNISWKLIKDNHKCNWNWSYISENPNITSDIVINNNRKWCYHRLSFNLFQKCQKRKKVRTRNAKQILRWYIHCKKRLLLLTALARIHTCIELKYVPEVGEEYFKGKASFYSLI
jgi:hypothetical protein